MKMYLVDNFENKVYEGECLRDLSRKAYLSMSYMYKLSCGMRKTSRWTIYSHGEDVTF